MDPLALLPYALAAAGGRLGAHDVTALVAAGVTLLQRSAPLVRTLAGRRSAVLLPPCASWLVALAASDGRSLVVLDPVTAGTDAGIEKALTEHDVGAVFTTQALLPKLPSGTPFVLLDDAPRRARVCAGGRDSEIDLGSHFALDLVGDTEGPGSSEECLRFVPSGATVTHADILDAARTAMRELRLTPLHRTTWATMPLTHDALVRELVAPLLVGGTVDVGAPA